MLWIALDGAVNVRDVGGLPTDDGSVTAAGRLLRADNLQGLSAADVSRLVDELGVTQVVDLRSAAEVTAEGPGPLAAVSSVRHSNLSLLPAERAPGDLRAGERIERRGPGRRAAAVVTDVLLSGREPAGIGTTGPPQPDEIVSGHYLGYLHERPDSVVGALRAIAGSPGTALVHCAAGKDRTGVIVALTLLAAGVRREAVVADYAATAERIGPILARLRASATYAESVGRISEQQHTPQPTAMNRFLDEVDRQHGGVRSWLAEQGFDTEDVDRLRGKLLAG